MGHKCYQKIWITKHQAKGQNKEGSCGLQGEAGYHQTSEEVGRDPLDIVGPLEHGHVQSQVLLMNATERA